MMGKSHGDFTRYPRTPHLFGSKGTDDDKLNVEVVDDLPVLRLSKLIEIKIACGLSHLRRTHKDLADVVEMIAVRKLDSSLAKYLHKSVRPTFRKLVRNAMSSD